MWPRSRAGEIVGRVRFCRKARWLHLEVHHTLSLSRGSAPDDSRAVQRCFTWFKWLPKGLLEDSSFKIPPPGFLLEVSSSGIPLSAFLIPDCSFGSPPGVHFGIIFMFFSHLFLLLFFTTLPDFILHGFSWILVVILLSFL